MIHRKRRRNKLEKQTQAAHVESKVKCHEWVTKRPFGTFSGRGRRSSPQRVELLIPTKLWSQREGRKAWEAEWLHVAVRLRMQTVSAVYSLHRLTGSWWQRQLAGSRIVLECFLHYIGWNKKQAGCCTSITAPLLLPLPPSLLMSGQADMLWLQAQVNNLKKGSTLEKWVIFFWQRNTDTHRRLRPTWEHASSGD